MSMEAMTEGMEAGKRGDSALRNPYSRHHWQQYQAWMAGWDVGIKLHRAEPRGAGLEFGPINGRRKGFDCFIK